MIPKLQYIDPEWSTCILAASLYAPSASSFPHDGLMGGKWLQQLLASCHYLISFRDREQAVTGSFFVCMESHFFLEAENSPLKMGGVHSRLTSAEMVPVKI